MIIMGHRSSGASLFEHSMLCPNNEVSKMPISIIKRENSRSGEMICLVRKKKGRTDSVAMMPFTLAAYVLFVL